MKFLVVQFRQIGDVVLTTPIPGLIKTHLPDSRIDFLTFKVNESLLAANPYISNVLTFRKNDGALSFLNVLKAVRSVRYDAVLDFQDTPRSTCVALFSGATHRVTYENTSRKMAYTDLVPPAQKGAYPTIFKANLLNPFIKGLSICALRPPKPEIYFSNEVARDVDDLLLRRGISEDDFIVTMAPTHRRETKRWPLDHFFDAAQYLISRYYAKIILSWGPGELDTIRAHRGFAESRHPNLHTDIELNLLQLAALMRKARMHIGNDSAPLHIATSQDLPTFTVFGSTSPAWSYPSKTHRVVFKDLDCRPCGKRRCRYGPAKPCLDGLTFDEIKDRLDEFIRQVVLC